MFSVWLCSCNSFVALRVLDGFVLIWWRCNLGFVLFVLVFLVVMFGCRSLDLLFVGLVTVVVVCLVSVVNFVFICCPFDDCYVCGLGYCCCLIYVDLLLFWCYCYNSVVVIVDVMYIGAVYFCFICFGRFAFFALFRLLVLYYCCLLFEYF